MKTIYRVESKHTGLGWYNHGHYIMDEWLERGQPTWQMLNSLINMDASPSPYHSDECLGGILAHEHCGFTSFEQMADWFPQSLLREILFGAMSKWFEIVEYRVEDDFVREGWYQCVFERSQSKSRNPIAFLPV